ncbi:MAG: tetratricopeptide repeat protein [Chitinophagaceae bacterium]|nr:tetratricopeptide repeat protein [Chitinophagaceae bacterium]
MIRVDQLLEEVQLLHSQGRYQKMIVLLNDAILEDDTYAEFYFYRGVAWFSNKTYDTAIEDFTKVIALRPDYFRAWLNRGISWSFKQQPNKAIPDLTRAMELRPGHASSYQYLGVAWSDKKEYDTAIGYFDKAIELRPDNAELYLQRGSAWSEKEKYQNAIEDYNKAIALQPDYASAYTSLGRALYKINEYGKAVQCFTRSIEIKPDNKRAYVGLARVYEVKKEFDLASLHYKRAYYLGLDGSSLLEVFRDRFPSPYIVKQILSVKNGDDSPEANFSNIEWLMATCKRWDDFLDHLRSKNYPATDPEKYYSLEAMVNYYMGNSPAAYRIFDTQFESDAHPQPLTLRDQYYLVLSAMDFKEPDDGLTYAIEQAGRTEDGGPVDSYYAGQLYLLHNDPDSALRSFEEAGPFLPALYGKMAVYRELGSTSALLQTAKMIEDAEATAKNEAGFLDGITPVVVHASMSFEEMFDRVLRHIHYYELTAEIEQARTLLHRTPRHGYLKFNTLPDFS